MPEEITKITPVSEQELNDLFNLAGPENVIIPAEPTKSIFNTIFNTKDSKINLVDEKIEVIPTVDPVVPSDPPDELDSALKLGDDQQIIPVADDKNKVKTPFLDAIKDLVKEDKLLLFEGDTPLEEYTKKELIELFEANQNRIRKEESEKAPAEFFDFLPPELQYAAKYVADGGKDLKNLFKHLAQAEEFKSLDITSEKGQEQTVRQYLNMTGYGTPEEIEEEVNSLKDQPGALEKKANQFKPKLDAKQQQIIDKELKDQEIRTKQQEVAAVKYRETVLKALQPGDLDGLKITPTIQGKLFNGLTQANYPSVNGRNTNLFGHLIEKYSYVEPNPTLIAKALWLLDDPKGFEDALKAAGNQAAVEDTVKKLKTAGSEKTTQVSIQQNNTPPSSRPTIKKQNANIFART